MPAAARFFDPVFPCNLEAKRRWCFHARYLQPLGARRWSSTELQRLQRATRLVFNWLGRLKVMHAELLESTLKDLETRDIDS